MRKRFYLLLLVLLGLPNYAVATRDICGATPPDQFREEKNESIKGDLAGKANFLSGFVGKAELGGKIEATRKEIFAKYPDANAAYMDRYLAYMFCYVLFDPENKQSPEDKIKAIQEFRLRQQAPPSSGPPELPSQPVSDFPGGSRRVYSADFSTWPRHDSNYGSIKLGFGNSYVMEPSSNTWIGPGRSIDIPPLENDFVFDVRFRIEKRYPSATLSFDLTGGGTDAESVDVFFDVWDEGNVTYSLTRGRMRSGGGLPVPHGVTEETIAEREQLSSALKDHDWSKGSKLTLKREGGRMQFFVNDGFVKEFGVSRFPVMKISVGAAFKSKVVVTSIEGRVKD